MNKIKNKLGVLTVKTLIIVTCFISMFILIITSLQKSFDINDQRRKEAIILENTMCDYSTFLYSKYGIYGVKDSSNDGEYHHTFSDENKDVEVKFSSSLDDTQVIKDSILQYMKHKTEINYLGSFLTKFEIIEKSLESNEIFLIKKLIDKKLEKYDNALKDRIFYMIKINNYKTEIIDKIPIISYESKSEILKKISDANDIKYEIEFIKNAIKNSENEEELKILNQELKVKKEEIDLIDNYLKGELEPLITYSYQLRKCLVSNNYYFTYTKIFVDDYDYINEEIDNTIYILNNLEVGIDEVKNNIIKELEDKRKMYAMIEPKFNNSYENVKSYLIENDIFIDEKWHYLFDEVITNISVLDDLITSSQEIDELANDSYLYLDEYFLQDLINSVNNIHNYKSFNDLEIVDETSATAEQKEIFDELIDKKNNQDYETEDESNYLKIEEYINTGITNIEFKEVLNYIKDKSTAITDSIIINEYIISTFRSSVKDSNSSFDYFDKYDRKSGFNKGEVEYIIFGNTSEWLNISASNVIIYSIRLALNTIHVYSSAEKFSATESAAAMIAGWTGFGVPVVSNILRVGWAAIESGIDMKNLLDGKEVTIYKPTNPDINWESSLTGFIEEELDEEVEVNPLSDITLNYHDYLRLMLISVSNEKKIQRIINLISINLNMEGRGILSNYYTIFETDNLLRGYYVKE